MSRLAEIVARRRDAVEIAKRDLPLAALEERLSDAGARRDFAGALRAPGLSVIAEVKRRAPSVGALAPEADAATVAAGYAAAGARALSVLTEPAYFDGRIEDLGAARAASGLPALRKDFVVDPYQIFESRLAGADAVLLIVATLGAATGAFLDVASELGLDALVEVHDETELRIALDAGAGIVGINNRNLADLTVDLGVTERLAPLVPDGVLLVAESGVASRDDARRMAAAGADAILVGSALMGSGDPGAALAEMLT